MQTLKIEIPKGFVIDSFDQKSGEIKFKESKNPIERINTDEDVFADNGLTQREFEKQCEGLEQHEVAYRFLNLLVKSLNPKGWFPDFDNSSQWKYEPRFLGGSSGFRSYDYDSWTSGSDVGSRLCFENEKLAIHAGTKFTKWYKKIIVTN